MPKRFTATEKWVDPWFCSLNNMDRMFWIYLIDNCNHAGIWQVNWALIKFYFGNYIPLKETFNERIVELNKDKWFIPKFIEFQYGELSPDNRAHQSVLAILNKEGAYKGLTRGLQGRKDKEPYKDKESKDFKDFGKFVKLTENEYNSICKRFKKQKVDESIEAMNDWISAKGKKPFRDYAAALRNWIKKDNNGKIEAEW